MARGCKPLLSDLLAATRSTKGSSSFKCRPLLTYLPALAKAKISEASHSASHSACFLLSKETKKRDHIYQTLHIPMPSLGSGAWLQALLERSTCNHAINQGFLLIQMQAPLDLSTCTWLQWQSARHHRIPFRSPSTRALRWVPSPPQRNGDPPATPPMHKHWVSRSPP